MAGPTCKVNVVPFRVSVEQPGQLHPADLAARLGVDLILDGDFARHDAVISVHGRLLDARSERATWQYAFETPANDARAMRAEIAAALVTQMQIQVGSDLRAQLQPDALTTSPQAYSDYLRALPLALASTRNTERSRAPAARGHCSR